MSPLQAWVDGMYKLWPNATADKPLQADYEPYDIPTPTVTIGNIVPELSPAVGPASISLQCAAGRNYGLGALKNASLAQMASS